MHAKRKTFKVVAFCLLRSYIKVQRVSDNSHVEISDVKEVYKC